MTAEATAFWLPDGRIKVTVSEGPGDFGAYYWTPDQAIAIYSALGNVPHRNPRDPVEDQTEPDLRPRANPRAPKDCA